MKRTGQSSYPQLETFSRLAELLKAAGGRNLRGHLLVLSGDEPEGKDGD